MELFLIMFILMAVFGIVGVIVNAVEDVRFEKEYRRQTNKLIHNKFLHEMARVRYGNRG